MYCAWHLNFGVEVEQFACILLQLIFLLRTAVAVCHARIEPCVGIQPIFSCVKMPNAFRLAAAACVTANWLLA